MEKYIKFRLAGTKAKIESNDTYLFKFLYSTFSCKNNLKRFVKYAKTLDTAITPTGFYEIGMTFDIIKIIKQNKYEIDIDIDKDLMLKLKPLSIDNVEIIQPENKSITYRDYQYESIRYYLKYGRGIFELPTGSGKSLSIYGIIVNTIKYTNCKHILLLVPSIQLVSQMHSDFISYGMDENIVQMFSSFSSEMLNKNVIISNRQWLEEHSDELPKIDAIIVDECHGLTRNSSVSKFVKEIPCNIKVGLTGSLPKDLKQQWNIKGVLGPILYTDSITNLQERKIIANVSIYPFKIHHKNKVVIDYNVNSSEAYIDEWNTIESNKDANLIITQITQRLPGNTIVLFNHTNHGKTLFSLLENTNKVYIDGTTELSIREEARERMEKSSDMIIVGNSSCIGTGINIKNVQNIVFASSYKSLIRVLQTIGRGLRLVEGKTKVNIIDIHHNYTISEAHFRQRCGIYSKHYNININQSNIKHINI